MMGNDIMGKAGESSENKDRESSIIRRTQMAFQGKNSREPVPEVETSVWSCTNDDCSGWMRDNFSFEDEPTCPICKSTMEKETRVLPEIK